MKTTTKIVLAFLVIATAFSACKKDEKTPAPVISGLEIGSNNSKTGYPGNDIHIEGEIIAPGKIASVTVEIHPESGTGWEFEQVYTEGLAGLKNADFHKHIDIPEDAALGSYHVHIKVTDQNGQTTEAESELEIKNDPTLPMVTGFEAEVEDGGAELHLEATINAANRIAKVTVEIHGGSYEEEYEYTDPVMVGTTTYHFHKHIDISAVPAGHYHVHLKVTDQANKEMEFEEHFDK